MSLYGKDDSNANKTKRYWCCCEFTTKTIVYIDETETTLAQNKNRGLNNLVGGHTSLITIVKITHVTRQSN